VQRWACEQVTPANIHDSQVLPWLLHGAERRVWGDSAYIGQAGVLSVCAPHARDFTHRRTASRATNRWKSRIRVRVELDAERSSVSRVPETGTHGLKGGCWRRAR
jgi:hypothetical protein